MIVNKIPHGGDHGDSSGTGSSPGFWGRLWGRIKSNIGSIIGGLIGGPIGAALGGWLQSVIDAGGDVNARVEIVAETPEKYPMTYIEQKLFSKMHVFQLQSTVKALANKIDETIVTQTLNRTKQSNVIVIEKANEVLWAISVIKANNTSLVNFGDGTKSRNFLLNKVELIELYLNALEKLVIKYVEDNTASSHKLILEVQNVSKITTIERLQINWQGQRVDANIKKYISRSQSTDDNTQVDVDVVDTDVNSPGDVTGTGIESQIDANEKENNKLLKIGFGILAGAIILKKI